eukprot:1099988-Amphidinium_carterae.1
MIVDKTIAMVLFSYESLGHHRFTVLAGLAKAPLQRCVLKDALQAKLLRHVRVGQQLPPTGPAQSTSATNACDASYDPVQWRCKEGVG